MAVPVVTSLDRRLVAVIPDPYVLSGYAGIRDHRSRSGTTMRVSAIRASGTPEFRDQGLRRSAFQGRHLAWAVPGCNPRHSHQNIQQTGLATDGSWGRRGRA